MANAYTDNPEVRHACVLDRFTKSKKADGSDTIPDWMGSLMVDCMEISKGENAQIINLLYSQAVSLDAMFVDLAARAASNFSEVEYFEAAKIYMQFALKAQNQSRATLQTLGEILNPKTVTIARQANIAGQQVVNNGGIVQSGAGRKNSEVLTTRTGENSNSTNELLGEVNHERLDTGTTPAASRVNQDVETVGKVHRGKNTGRKKTQ